MTVRKKPEIDLMNEVNRVPMKPESRAKMSLNIYDLQYLIRLQEMSNQAFMSEMKEIYEKDNEFLCRNVSEYVCANVAETIAPIWKRLEDLDLVQARIMGLLDKMDERMKKIEDMVFITDEQRIQKLERYSCWGNTMLRGAVYVVTAVAIAMILFQILHV